LKPDAARRKELLDYDKFAGNQAKERGIPTRFDGRKAAGILKGARNRIAFFHVTEYEDALDGKGKTAEFISRLFSFAKAGLRA
jgi:hypothetical protein